jgi:hypothetical protein
MYPVYLVRVSFCNRHGSPFHWDFRIETDDYATAVDEAVLTFWSGLTLEERCDAAETFNIMAQMYYLPEPVSSSPKHVGHAPRLTDASKNPAIPNKSKNLK